MSLVQSKVWKEGPQFLLEDEISWPSDPPGTCASQNDVQEECKMERTNVAQVSEENVLNPWTFSSLRRLVSITAWIKRFVNNCKCPVELRVFSSDLSAKEFNEAETYWLKRAQIERFQDAKGRNNLENLNPIKDAEGLIRIDGRLRHADLPYNSKHPVILSKEHPIVEPSRHYMYNLVNVSKFIFLLKLFKSFSNVIHSGGGCYKRDMKY